MDVVATPLTLLERLLRGEGDPSMKYFVDAVDNEIRDEISRHRKLTTSSLTVLGELELDEVCNFIVGGLRFIWEYQEGGPFLVDGINLEAYFEELRLSFLRNVDSDRFSDWVAQLSKDDPHMSILRQQLGGVLGTGRTDNQLILTPDTLEFRSDLREPERTDHRIDLFHGSLKFAICAKLWFGQRPEVLNHAPVLFSMPDTSL